ncbi:MAG: hypothetical protein IPK83_06565 [Planctomycetes bacterium]|nr:hypothetical protein [Planctomycetota bacterium]
MTQGIIGRIRSMAERTLVIRATSRFSDDLIRVPSRVALNIHYALLPGYAGLSPYYWYVHHQEPQAGITMHVIHSKLDAGPIICQERFGAEKIKSVLGLLIKQMELVSPVLNRYYAGELHEAGRFPKTCRAEVIFDIRRASRSINFAPKGFHLQHRKMSRDLQRWPSRFATWHRM